MSSGDTGDTGDGLRVSSGGIEGADGNGKGGEWTPVTRRGRSSRQGEPHTSKTSARTQGGTHSNPPGSQAGRSPPNLQNRRIQRRSMIHTQSNSGIPPTNWKNVCFAASAAVDDSRKLKYVPPKIVEGKKIAALDQYDTLKAQEKWNHTITGYIMGKRPFFPHLKANVTRQWKIKGALDIFTRENGFFLFKLSQAEDYEHILENGPWFFDGRLMILKPWNASSGLDRELLNSIPTWDYSDATAQSEPPNCSSQPESERGRVENIIRLLSAGNSTASSWCEEIDAAAAGVSDQRDCPALPSPRANSLRVRGRREIEELMVRLEQERRKELEKLMERQAVSRFSYRGRLQSLLRFMSLRRELAAQEQPRSAPRSSELDQLQMGSTILSIRQRFNRREQHDGSGEPIVERLRTFSLQPADFQISSYSCAHQFSTQTSNNRSEHDGSENPAPESLSSLHVQFCNNSHDSGYSGTSDQFLQHSFNKRSQHDGNAERVAESSSSFIIQLPDNSKDSQLNRQTSNHRNQHDGSEDPAPESLSAPHVQFSDSSQDAVYTCTVDQFLQQFNHIRQHDGSGEAAAEISSNLQLQYPDISQNSGYSCTSDQFTSDNNQYQEVTYPRNVDDIYPEVSSPQFRSEDLQEGISTDGSWDERNLWVSSLDLQRPMDSSVAQSLHSEAVSEEMEPYTRQDVRLSDGTWISDSSNSWGAWDVSQQGIYHDSPENYSDNMEIRELLERRRVTTSLASGFRETMNRLIISFLQRQEQHYGDEDPYDEQYLWRQNNGFYNTDQGTTDSSSLVPLPYRTIHQPDSWHDTTFVQSSPQHLMEIEARQDLRSDIAQIHHEICELRKLVESCMGWQTKLQHSIKQEVSGAFREAVRVGDSSNWTPMRKGSCCICCEMPIDSLLYRCGHMCTCFKCAHELQWSSGRCPICRAPIVDVVRAYTNS